MKILTDAEFRELEESLGAKVQYITIKLGGLFFDGIKSGASILDEQYVTCNSLILKALMKREKEIDEASN